MRKAPIALAVIAILVVAAPSLGAPRSTAKGSLALGGTSARISAPSLGGTVRIDAAYSGVRKQDVVRVQLICMQGGSVVYGDARTLSTSPTSNEFELGQASTTASSVWTTGGASCRSDLFVISPGSDPTFLATLTFEAS